MQSEFIVQDITPGRAVHQNWVLRDGTLLAILNLGENAEWKGQAPERRGPGP